MDARSWISLRQGKRTRRRPFLFHVKALSRVFRAKFIAALERTRRDLCYVGQSAALAEEAPWKKLIAELWKENWVVYSKAPFGGPEPVLKYLSRYTYRVAISNRRIVSLGNGLVRFEYRDYADHNNHKVLALPATEFLRRFLQHVVPKGFMRIRHYGITANCRRGQKLARCRALLGATAAPAPATATAAACADLTASNAEADFAAASRCPQCGGPLRLLEILPPTTNDTS